MRSEERLPIFRGKKEKLLRDMNNAAVSKENFELFFKNSFTRIPEIETPKAPTPPPDAWHVQSLHTIDYRTTTFDERYVLRHGKEGEDKIAELHFVTW